MHLMDIESTTDLRDSLTACTDEQLACRMQAGCRESFAELDRRYRPRLLHVLSHRVPQRADAEDLVQQTMLRVFEKIHLYNPHRRWSPWVFTVAMRLAADHARRRQPPAANSEDLSRELVDSVSTPVEQLVAREQRNLLWQVAERIVSPEQWTALWLFYGEGLTLAEVAQALGRTRAGTSVLLFRARKTLLPHLRAFAESTDDPPEPPYAPSTETLLVESRT
jgi:RNA polymerase sigma-70 factor (ECF subfamily)